jgi:hypothetical protein
MKKIILLLGLMTLIYMPIKAQIIDTSDVESFDEILVSAQRFEQKRKDGRQKEAIKFFLSLANCNIKHIAIENPVGIMSNVYKKPTQIIQPYYFGDQIQKTTCLWLKNLPKRTKENG